MKAQKSACSLQSLLVAGLLFAFCPSTAGQSFSGGKNLHQLKQAVSDAKSSGWILLSACYTAPLPVRANPASTAISLPGILTSPPAEGLPPALPYPIPTGPLLPRWSAECLPFFCRIEHDISRKSAVPVKFRLGSVEYVDWLEGKGEW